MSRRKLDITGQTFGRLTVVGFSHSENQRAAWNVVCSCGNAIAVRGDSLRRGKTTSCGCLQREIAASTPLMASRRHGKTRTPEWWSWTSMIQRCNDKYNPSYPRYRDVPICARWRNSFPNFLADMGKRPDGTTLDRIDNTKGYFPENCRWATLRQQAMNKRNSILVAHDGITMAVDEWAASLGMSKKTIYSRLETGKYTAAECLSPLSLKTGKPLRSYSNVSRPV